MPYNFSIYNNRLVDNDSNFKIWDFQSTGGVNINTNISAIYTSGLVHVDGGSNANVNWSNNEWNTTVTGRPATNAVYADRFVNKGVGVPPGWAGWRSLVAGSVTTDTFALTGESPLPVVTVSVTDAVATEEDETTATFSIACDSCSGLSVPFTLTGTATVTSDYTATSSPVTITNQTIPATVTITAVDDDSFEEDESVILTVNESATYTRGDPHSGTVTIIDNEAGSDPAMYVAFGEGDTGAGTSLSPVTSIARMEGILTADPPATHRDIYFLCGTTSGGDERLVVPYSGTSADRMVIGAYYIDDGVPIHGVNGDGKPKFTGTLGSYPTSGLGLVHVSDKDYVTIQDLELETSGGDGVHVTGGSTYVNVVNVDVDRATGRGIIYLTASGVGVSNGLIEGCTVIRSAYNAGSGGGIVLNASNTVGSVTGVTVRNNTVYNGWEGIGLYSGASGNNVFNNTVYDCRSHGINNGTSSHTNTISGNVIYESSDYASWGNGATNLIKISNATDKTVSVHTLTVYGNYLASGGNGIYLENLDPNTAPYGITLSDNYIVDCATNINFAATWDSADTTVSGLISGIIDSGGTHITNSGSATITYSNNIFTSTVTGAPATGATILPDIYANSNFYRELVAGSVTEDQWRTTNMPMVSVEATDATAAEADESSGTFSISCTEEVLGDCTGLEVDFTLGGSATNGTDYTEITPLTVTIVDDETPSVVTITAIDDSVCESDETVEIEITSSADYDIGDSSSTITITDDDCVVATGYMSIGGDGYLTIGGDGYITVEE
jgi:parallel beta-helix repeat protein